MKEKKFRRKSWPTKKMSQTSRWTSWEMDSCWKRYISWLFLRMTHKITKNQSDLLLWRHFLYFDPHFDPHHSFQILKIGHPDERPTRLNLAKVNILGKLEDGTVVEDFKDLTVQIGDFEVVQGVDMAIPLMDVGETCELQVDSRFAYGPIGFKSASQNIPPDSKVRKLFNDLSSN